MRSGTPLSKSSDVEIRVSTSERACRRTGERNPLDAFECDSAPLLESASVRVRAEQSTSCPARSGVMSWKKRKWTNGILAALI